MVAGLSIGADDYIAKPFNTPQLLARVEAVLRRSRRTPTPRPPHPPSTAQPTPAQGSPQHLATPAPRPTLPRLGPQLSAARHDRGLSLHDASHVCGVRWEFLQAIEQEQFSYVPRAELRIALRSYSTLLGIDLSTYQRRPRAPRRSAHQRLALVATLVVILLIGLLLI